ncbi:MAG TPA: NAD-dependent epimerase/dehydratase family protein, partial [Steroidobacteraceae bacterium]|nr:NAD-dependent epimerase/dehydratase family protein [Steroidobacteraceae bacterium]
MSVLITLITAQALLGAVDNLWHHEVTERLPSKRAASTELALHATREFLYAFIFVALAWFEWRGAWAALIAAIFAAEIGITLADFVVEDRTRRLPAFERVLHTVMAINFGVVLAVLVPVLAAWWAASTAVMPAHYGAMSWVFTLFAAGVFLWSARDAIAALRHRRPPEWVRDPIVAGTSSTGRCVLVTGATGFIGGHLVRRLIARGDAVIVLTRDADRALDRFGPHVRIVTNLDALDASTCVDAIVNLAGAPILGAPWTQGRRRKLIASRVD